jgi:hypothetical protein
MSSLKQVIKPIRQLAWSSAAESAAIDSFRTHGLTLIQGNDEFRSAAAHFRGVLNSILNEYVQLAKSKPTGLGMGKESGYRELVQKDLGRYDLNLDHLMVQKSSPRSRKFSDNERDMINCKDKVADRIAPMLEKILGTPYQMNTFGAITSGPGTIPQKWHVDTSCLFHSSEYPQFLPCYCTTVFFPLYAFREDIGPTEVALGTHRFTDRLKNEHVEDQYPEGEPLDRLLNEDGVSRILMETEPGDIGKL